MWRVHGFFHALVRHLPVQYNPFRLWDDGKLKNFTVQPGVRYWMRETYGRGCFIGSTVCSPYIMRVVCSDIATVTKAQLSAAGFLRGWCAPFRVAGIWSSNWVSVFVWADWERYRCVNCGKRTGKGSVSM